MRVEGAGGILADENVGRPTLEITLWVPFTVYKYSFLRWIAADLPGAVIPPVQSRVLTWRGDTADKPIEGSCRRWPNPCRTISLRKRAVA
jgi:hypothetical protein